MMKTNKTIQKVKKTLIENNLVSKNDRVLIGLSGGADSVFLLYALKTLSKETGFEIGACHVEHGIRGSESLHDMEFSKKLCMELDIPFYARQFDVPAVSKKEKISIETAARNVRYSYFELRVKHNLSEDEAQTFVKLAKNKLENMNYKVYLKGERFVFDDANRIVDENEYLIAIKD